MGLLATAEVPEPRGIEREDLACMRALDAVCHESLRLMAPSPIGGLRELARDTEARPCHTTVSVLSDMAMPSCMCTHACVCTEHGLLVVFHVASSCSRHRLVQETAHILPVRHMHAVQQLAPTPPLATEPAARLNHTTSTLQHFFRIAR